VKKLLIHIGPPKTGTSAIQYWLNSNRSILSENGIYYPKHALDKNKVSSGNLFSIFTLDEDNRLSLNNRKFNRTLRKFERSGAQTLLLSSERFFTDIEVLSKLFEDAKFIAYVINPLDFTVSIYNQSVKRRRNTKPYHFSTILKRPIMELKDAIERIGSERFHLRAYIRDAFINGDIVNDFLSYLKISPSSQPKPQKVNPSYGFEALEVKRWLNQFDLGGIDSIIDGLLEQFEQGDRNYSCIPPVLFEKCKTQSIDMLTEFCRQNEIVNGDRLVEAVRMRSQPPYREQVATHDEFKAVALFIKDKAEPIYHYICKHIHDQPPVDQGMNAYREAFTYWASDNNRVGSIGALLFSQISWGNKIKILSVKNEWFHRYYVLLSGGIKTFLKTFRSLFF